MFRGAPDWCAEPAPGVPLGGWRQRCYHEVGRLVCRGSEQRELGRPSRLVAWPGVRPTRNGQAENLPGEGWRGDESKHAASPAARTVEDVEPEGPPQETSPIQSGTSRSARPRFEFEFQRCPKEELRARGARPTVEAPPGGVLSSWAQRLQRIVSDGPAASPSLRKAVGEAEPVSAPG